MARYLVTGGCGFIGSHLVDALQRAGHRVTVLDDLSTGKRRNVSPATKVIVGSVTDAAAVSAALEAVDGVFHLAAIASVDRSREEWRATHTTNLTGLINVLDAVKDGDAPIPVVYASSAAVYGNAETTPIAESAPLRPLTAYGADKLGCELHAHVGAVVHRIPTTGLRFFNVYGPRQDPRSPYSGVISVFCDRLRRGQPIEIHGDGEQVRDFIYVADVVAFLLRAMETSIGGARVFNVCTGAATSVSQLANIIAELCRAPLAINFRPPRTGDIRVSVGAAALASERLGLRARVNIRDGLQRTLAWMAEETTTGPGAVAARRA
jgi:UDP-glucose 4-epimerase